MRGAEYEANQTNKRGIVVDRDPKGQRIRVQFDDEDGVVSHWIDVLASSGGGTKTYMMPDDGDEVWCALDAKGETGCLMGVKYNANAAPPFSSNDDIGLVWGGGSVHVNKASGAVIVKTSGAVTIEAGGTVKIKASSIELESGSLTHNGVNVGDTHTHGGVKGGSARTTKPG